MVKGIEACYAKIHLCGVFVHKEDLYSNLWIDFHKYSNNQVITSSIYMIVDVQIHNGGTLPSTLHIQVANSDRENKN